MTMWKRKLQRIRERETAATPKLVRRPTRFLCCVRQAGRQADTWTGSTPILEEASRPELSAAAADQITTRTREVDVCLIYECFSCLAGVQV